MRGSFDENSITSCDAGRVAVVENSPRDEGVVLRRVLPGTAGRSEGHGLFVHNYSQNENKVFASFPGQYNNQSTSKYSQSRRADFSGELFSF